MKKMLIVLIASAVLAAQVVAAPAKKSPPASDSGIKRMAIGSSGTEVPGIGLRLWTNDTQGWDLNLGFSSQKNSSTIGLGGSLVNVLKQTAHLKFLRLIGLQYISNSNKTTSTSISAAGAVTTADVTTTVTDTIIGFGFGVEYSFTELPELCFDAFLTGIGMDMKNTSGGGVSESDTAFATNPRLGFAVRYYIK